MRHPVTFGTEADRARQETIGSAHLGGTVVKGEKFKWAEREKSWSGLERKKNRNKSTFSPLTLETDTYDISCSSAPMSLAPIAYL